MLAHGTLGGCDRMTDLATAEAADMVDVSAEALVVAYCQISMLRAMTRGVERREASKLGWRMLQRLVAVAGGSAPSPGADAGRVNCLANHASTMRRALGMSFQAFEKRVAGRPAPVTSLSRFHLDQVLWLIDAVRRVSHGVPLLDAARQAHDASIGRSRRKRAPAEMSWLRDQIEGTLFLMWSAVRDAQKYMDGPTWVYAQTDWP